MKAIRFAVNLGTPDRGAVKNEEAASFEDFYSRVIELAAGYPAPAADATDEERKAIKGKAAPFFCRPMGGDGRRGNKNAEAARFIALDIDDDLTPKAKPQVETACGLLSAFVYDTVSSTEEHPHLRIVVEATREILPHEVSAATQSLAFFLRDQCPDWQGKIDDCSEREAQYYCTPTDKAAKSAQLFHGEPFDVDKYVTQYAAEIAANPMAKKAKGAVKAARGGGEATAEELTPPLPFPDDFRDPVVKCLDELGMILGAGKADGEWRIVCPFESEHTAPHTDDDTSTVYREAGSGGLRYGQFICMHGHCANRPQEEFFKAVGVDNARYKAEIDTLLQRPDAFIAGRHKFTRDADRVYAAEYLGAEGYGPRTPWFARLEVVAATRDADGNNRGRLVRFTDADGGVKEIILPDADIVGDAATIRKTLASRGLRFFSMAKNAPEMLTKYLYNCPCAKRMRIVDAVGWYTPHGQKKAVYVLPAETITAGDVTPEGAAGAEAVRYFSATNTAADWHTRGTAEEWRKTVGALASQSRPLTLAIGAALGAPLARLIGLGYMTGGFHFYGKSSSGKTTLLKAAVSVYGNPEKGGRLTGWNDTANSLEAQAAANNDGLLCLDEASTAGAGMRSKGAALADTIYRLSNGVEKGRLTKSCDARARREWFCILLSSAELTIREAIERGGGVADVGTATRLIDIPINGGEDGGLFDKADAGADAKALWAALADGAHKNFGALGRDWLAFLVANQTALGERAQGLAAAFSKAVGEVPAGQHTRAFDRFKLCAAAYGLACEAGILGADATEGVKDIATLYKQWAADYGEGSQEDARLIERLREACHQDANFPTLTEFENSLSAPAVGRTIMGYQETAREGAGKGDALTAPVEGEGGPVRHFNYLLTEAFAKIRGTVSARAACATLIGKGILIPGSEKSSQVKKVNGRARRFYVIDADALEAVGCGSNEV